MTNEMTTNANTNQASSQTNNGLTPTGATSVHGLTVLGEGLPKLRRGATIRTVAIDATEAMLLASHASSMSLKSLHEASHACACCVVGAADWPGIASVFGSRADAAHLRIKSIDATDRAGGHTHIAREYGRAFSTSQDMAAQVVIALAGIAAERLYSTPTDGGESDLRAATRICSQIVAMGADLHAVGSDGQPGSLMPSMDSIGDKATEVLKHEYIVRMRRILDDAMAEALRICRMRQNEIVGLANKVIEAGGRLSDQAVLDALKAVGMPVADSLTVDDRDE